MANGKSKRSATIAERYLKEARDSQQQASLYLVNGFRLKGEILEFDKETILFKHKGIHELVMRSAVAAMYPLESTIDNGNGWWHAYLPAEAVEAEQPSGNGKTD